MGSWTEETKGKLAGALFMFIVQMAPMLAVNLLDEGMGRMGGHKLIKAVLKRDIDYKDLAGHTKTIKQGEVIDLYIVKAGSTGIDMRGNRVIQSKQSYIATKGFDSFDLEQDEFKTID